ncbi:AraC family transcriptional regulator [uncultured Robinsoniella sp.]|uniref:AraC family transcriptional regulator n=1 Tax=uncultured Robinsoniella sp. TaxID=904190 RepID=UPI00374FAD9E
MEWTESIKKTISYIETHLLNQGSIQHISKKIGISNFYLQKGFKLMTGYSISEYIKNRRLYLAALDVIAHRDKIIDLSYKYGYETPESFTKAFVRFHGLAPRELRKNPAKIKIFLPLKIKISIQGGNNMNYTVEKMKSFKVIGFQNEVPFDTSYQVIPKIWDNFAQTYLLPLYSKEQPEGDIEETICNSCIGEYGICIDDLGSEENFRYIIGGHYNDGKIPEGMIIYEFPEMLWAKFSCKGPLPESLQSINTKIFSEWLPGNSEYEIAMGANIEWYSKGDIAELDYESEIWIPVKQK